MNNLTHPKIKSYPEIKIIQINLRHCARASEDLAAFMEVNNIHLALIQDPYINKEGHFDLVPKDWPRFHSKRDSAIVLIRSKELIYTHLFTGTNCTFITLTTKKGECRIGSVYIAPKQPFTVSLEEWSHLISKKTPLIVGGDFNANSPLWNCTKEDIKGAELIEYCAIHELVLANSDDSPPPTFQTDYQQGWPDLTIATPNIINNILNWTVHDVDNSSDYQYIPYTLGETSNITTRRRFNTKYSNFQKF